MAWSNTAAAITQLRTLINDGPTDKYADQKEVFGQVNGTNLQFKTFENRRVTTFTSAAWPTGVYQNGVIVNVANIAQDDTESGNFQFAAGQEPTAAADVTDGNKLTASYYYQWFEDTELDGFLQGAATWLGFGTTYIGIPNGLNLAALKFAANEAYAKAAMRYSTRASQMYKLEDAPSEDILKSIAAFQTMAKELMSSAEDLRDDYYKGSGAANAPNFAIGCGRVRDPVPRR